MNPIYKNMVELFTVPNKVPPEELKAMRELQNKHIKDKGIKYYGSSYNVDNYKIKKDDKSLLFKDIKWYK